MVDLLPGIGHDGPQARIYLFRDALQFRRNLAHNGLDYVPGAERKTAVVEDRAQPVFGHRCFQHEQGAQLGVAVLLHNKTIVMALDKVFDALVEGEAPDTHIVGCDTARSEQVYGFADGRIAAADGNNADAGIWPALDYRGRDEFRSGLMLLEQAVDYFLILGGRFGVAAELIVTGATREERAFGVDARQRARRHEVLVFRVITLELGHLVNLLRVQYPPAIRLIAAVPGKARHHPIVHPNIEICHQEYRSLKPFREIERFGGELEAFSGVGWKKQNMFGIAMGGVGCFHEIALLRPCGHAGGWTDALHVDNNRRDLGVVRQAQELVHERDARA